MWAGPIDDADLVNLASCISWNMASNDSCEDHNTDSMSSTSSEDLELSLKPQEAVLVMTFRDPSTGFSPYCWGMAVSIIGHWKNPGI